MAQEAEEAKALEYVAKAEAMALHAASLGAFSQRVMWRTVPVVALESAGMCISKAAGAVTEILSLGGAFFVVSSVSSSRRRVDVCEGTQRHVG